MTEYIWWKKNINMHVTHWFKFYWEKKYNAMNHKKDKVFDETLGAYDELIIAVKFSLMNEISRCSNFPLSGLTRYFE